MALQSVGTCRRRGLAVVAAHGVSEPPAVGRSCDHVGWAWAASQHPEL